MHGRSRSILWAAGLIAVLAALLVSCGTRQPRLIPRSVLFGNPEKARVRLSPEGERLAYVAPVDGVLNVWIQTIGEDDARAVTTDDKQGIYRYFWARDGEHILYLQDAEGDENWRLYVVDLESGEIRDLTPFEGVQVQLIEYTKHHPGTIIIAMNRQDPRLHDAYSLDIESGELELVARNPGNAVGWIADFNLDVRGCVVATPDGGLELLVRETEDSVWESVVKWSSVDAMTSGPFAFTRDGGGMYLVDSRNVNAGRLVKLDFETNELEVIAEDASYDVEDVLMNPDTVGVEAVSFYAAREEWTYVSDAVKDDFEAIAPLDDGDYSVVSRDDEDDTWIVAFLKDDGPITYYLYDRDAKSGEFLLVHRSELLEYALAPMEPVSFESRDGMAIHGYITYPQGLGRRNLPMVLNVHGGPHARDKWGYNPEAQWLANRGYVHLQVNFRGSTGYGKDFLNAGDKEWGGKMQDDLVDAVNWAIDEGIADPERVAIWGASYGGYAALVGATFTPDLFACAVPMMGPSNLITFIESIPPYWTTMLEMVHRRIGNPETEAEFLKSRSPLFKVDQIGIPMLMAQGANDPRVKQSESEQIVEAMREKGIDVEYVLFPDEGHGFLKQENRLHFYGIAEEFLAEHLGGRRQESSGEAAGS